MAMGMMVHGTHRVVLCSQLIKKRKKVFCIAGLKNQLTPDYHATLSKHKLYLVSLPLALGFKEYLPLRYSLDFVLELQYLQWKSDK
jgi:hypothetical protein